jgi:hypothetical protein
MAEAIRERQARIGLSWIVLPHDAVDRSVRTWHHC